MAQWKIVRGKGLCFMCDASSRLLSTSLMLDSPLFAPCSLALQAPDCLASSSLPCNCCRTYLGPQFEQEWEVHILSSHWHCPLWTRGEKDLESGIPCAVSWAGEHGRHPDLVWQGCHTLNRCVSMELSSTP